MYRCKLCTSSDTILVEYAWDHPGHWDGWNEILCLKCKRRTGRWSGKELKGKEYEDGKLRYSLTPTPPIRKKRGKK